MPSLTTTARHLRLALPLTLAACAAPGERATTGQCPIGEDCSPTTPRGLTFEGPAFGDTLFGSGLHPTATGGTQSITLRHAASGNRLDQTFTPLVDDDAFIATARGPIVDLAASAQAETSLRIVDGDGRLMDRIDVAAQTPARLAGRTLDTMIEPGRDLAMVPDRPQRLTVAILALGDLRLVDDSMTIAVTGAPASREGWDTVALTPIAGTPIVLDVVAGTLTSQLRIEPSATADRIALQPAGPLTLGVGAVVCVTPLTGERQLVGVTPTWTALAGATVAGTGGLLSNCALVTPSQASVRLAVAVAGASAEFTLTAGTARLAPPPPAAAPSGLGDRARLTAE